MLRTSSSSILLTLLLYYNSIAQPQKQHDLHFNQLATRWDEAIPLGNGMLGALIWQKESNLRFSLDRADLWDQRPMKGLHRKEFSYQWVIGQVQKKEYSIVQKYFDEPYEKEPAPSKLPGGAMEFNTKQWGPVLSVHLNLQSAVCEVKWENGIVLRTLVHATKPIGWFCFNNVDESTEPKLIPPQYEGESKGPGGSVEGDDLSRLGYQQGPVMRQGNSITYQQPCWDGFVYEINIQWRRPNKTTLEGVWSISAHPLTKKKITTASTITQQALQQHFSKDSSLHLLWWKNFWSRSSLQVPDTLIEKQWYLEQYKFGATARRGAPPISLQAIWTADNGKLPPWKGDYHHDLNTQLSYWPCYSGNHLDEGLSYFDHLDENRSNYLRYTKRYFGVDGLAVPGVTTLDGTEMGGWIQYSFSPTVSAWLAHHYYLHWQYSRDTVFLRKRAYPWIKETARFLENITTKDEKGFRKLPISSSPEINNNSLSAWFQQNTNYDLALMKFVFAAATEMAYTLKRRDEERHWQKIATEFVDYSIDERNVLKFAPSLPYNQSHRHFSHSMAIHPLGLIKWEDGPKAQAIIQQTLRALDSIGPSAWCGYSYSWLANLKARAKDGIGAANALSIFAKAFCSINSFHLNGDQTKSGYSGFTYRPFTLEGNFAFAAGLQEMLLQSYAGFIEIMPAIPLYWKNVSFRQLRAEGAFLVNAEKQNGIITKVEIVSEKGGSTKLKLPFAKWKIAASEGIKAQQDADVLTLDCKAGGKIVLLKNG